VGNLIYAYEVPEYPQSAYEGFAYVIGTTRQPQLLLLICSKIFSTVKVETTRRNRHKSRKVSFYVFEA
jgi:hypothetical protein